MVQFGSIPLLASVAALVSSAAVVAAGPNNITAYGYTPGSKSTCEYPIKYGSVNFTQGVCRFMYLPALLFPSSGSDCLVTIWPNSTTCVGVQTLTYRIPKGKSTDYTCFNTTYNQTDVSAIWSC